MDQYLLFLNGEQKGPFTLGQLRSMWGTGGITADTLFWQEGNTDWLPITTLISQLEPPTTPKPCPVPPPLRAAVPPPISKGPPPGPKKAPSAKKNLTPAQTAAALIGGFGAIALMIYFNSGGSSNQTSSQTDTDTTQVSQDTVPAPQAIADISWDSIDAIYNLKSTNTDLQKDQAWTQFKGKRVRWTGKVSTVGNSFGSLTMQVKMNPDTFTSDLIVTLRDSEKSKAEQLHQGDSVTFSGTLDSWGTLLPISLSDGEIDQ